MLTKEEYFELNKNSYYTSRPLDVQTTILKDSTIVLSDLLDKLGDVDYKNVTIEAYEYGGDYWEVEVTHTRTETEEEYEIRKNKIYTNYVEGYYREQESQLRMYKELKLKFEGGIK